MKWRLIVSAFALLVVVHRAYAPPEVLPVMRPHFEPVPRPHVDTIPHPSLQHPEIKSDSVFSHSDSVDTYLHDHPGMRSLFDGKRPSEQQQLLELLSAEAAERQRLIDQINGLTGEPQQQLDFLNGRAALPRVSLLKPLIEKPITFDPATTAGTPQGFATIPDGYKGIVLVENAANLKAARAAAPKGLVIIRRSANPDASLARLNQKPESLTIIHDFPQDTNAAAKIHGRKVSKEQINEVLAARRHLEEIVSMASYRVKHTDLSLLAGATPIAERVKAMLAANTAGHLVLLLGHIDAGAIRFHDGSVLPLADVPHPEDVWVLGCRTVWDKLGSDGLQLATGRAIRYRDATAAVETIVHGVDNRVDYRTMALSL